MKDVSFIEGRYETTDLIAHARIDEIRRRITDEALTQAEEAGKTLRALSISPAERDRTVFDPLDQRWVVKWKATLE